MTKKTKIIIAITVFIIAMVLFLFWDKIKAKFHKDDVTEVMPPSASNTNNGGGATVNTTQGSPSIGIVELKKGDLIKARKPVKVYATYANWHPSTAIELATLKPGDFAGVVHEVTPVLVKVYFENQKASVVKDSITKM